MKRPHLLATGLLCNALALGCVVDNSGNDTQSSPTSTSTSTTSGEQSGSVTSAPGSAPGSATGSATDDTVGDSTPTMATATTTGPGTSADTSSTGEACSFLNCDDMHNDTKECDNWAQDCPDGQKCTAYIAGGGGAWDATKCVEVTGTDQPGEPCTSEGAISGIDSCIKGAMCWGVNMDGVGTCVALCTGSPEAPVCENKAACTVGQDSILILCIPTCDPLLQDCANPSEGCYPIGESFTCAPDASGDEGQANDPCAFINVCDKGLMCADAAFVGAGCEPPETGCCTPFCKFPGGACPNADQKCVQYFVEPFPMDPENAEDIGVCGVPG
jgi:hypothetical protein